MRKARSIAVSREAADRRTLMLALVVLAGVVVTLFGGLQPRSGPHGPMERSAPAPVGSVALV